jgi:hypothetical protein
VLATLISRFCVAFARLGAHKMSMEAETTSQPLLDSRQGGGDGLEEAGGSMGPGQASTGEPPHQPHAFAASSNSAGAAGAGRRGYGATSSGSAAHAHTGPGGGATAMGPQGSAGGQRGSPTEDSRFECNICLDQVNEPVVTLCGHLFW